MREVGVPLWVYTYSDFTAFEEAHSVDGTGWEFLPPSR